MEFNNIFRNYPLKDIDTESDVFFVQKGGNDDVPNGGFPPIYVCKNKSSNELKGDDNIKREYETHNTAISIKDILKKKQRSSPFIKL